MSDTTSGTPDDTETGHRNDRCNHACSDAAQGADEDPGPFDEDDDTVATVCLEHQRFVPCRRCGEPNPQVWSTDMFDVEAVRDLQTRRSMLDESSEVLVVTTQDSSEKPAPRRSIQPTPFVDALVKATQQHLGRNGRRKVSYAAALTWIVEDFAWCEPDKPAFGRMSPVMSGIVRDVMEAQ